MSVERAFGGTHFQCACEKDVCAGKPGSGGSPEDDWCCDLKILFRDRAGVVGTVSECNWEFKSDGHKWAKIPYCVSVSFGDDRESLQR